MESVTKRDVNQQTARVLARATTDNDILITERGVPMWRLTRIDEHEAPLAAMQREGRYTPPAATPTPWPQQPSGPSYTDEEVDALLDEFRGEH